MAELPDAVDTPPSGAAGSARPRMDPARGIAVCPFLRSGDSAWTSAYASRDLRCWAVSPAAAPTAQKQRSLCQLAAHEGCATYRAATAIDAQAAARGGEVGLWPEASGIPVALDPVRARPGIAVGAPPTGGQALLVGLMVVAFLVLVIARANPLAGGGASPSPVLTPAASGAVGSAVASSSPEPSVEITASPSAPAATSVPSPSATPTPTASPRTYTVRSGDTIAGIAAKFHSTVKAIVAANNIVDARTIHPGQVLIIP